MVDDKSYTLTKVQSPSSGMERTYDMHNATVVNTATMVKKSAKRDILAPKGSPEKKIVSPPHRSPPSRISPINTGIYRLNVLLISNIHISSFLIAKHRQSKL